MSNINWHLITPQAQQEFAPRAAELIANGTVVKANAVRTVLRSEDYFIKVERRKHHSFTGEFAIAQALTAANIPVVEHLACGSDADAHYLVTRALPDAVEVTALRKSAHLDDDFLQNLSAFLTAFAHAPFIHNDFHCGNILCANGNFTLVDVCAVRRKWWWEKFHLPRSAFHPLTEFRSRLSAGKLTALFANCGIKDAPGFYRSMWHASAAALFKEWRKRRQQLFAAYPKFSFRQSGLLCRTDAQNSLAGCREVSSPLAAEIFALGLFLELAGIPAAQVAAVDIAKNKYFLANAGTIQPDGGEISDAAFRLGCFKLSLPEELWGTSPDRLPAVTSPEAMEHLAVQLSLILKD
ncbi:MAG: fructosamine kinase family protein [Lentisphaeria bacterium]|nr:fructosamine kinase family protein [Lentisphaeria bacterium]